MGTYYDVQLVLQVGFSYHCPDFYCNVLGWSRRSLSTRHEFKFRLGKRSVLHIPKRLHDMNFTTKCLLGKIVTCTVRCSFPALHDLFLLQFKGMPRFLWFCIDQSLGRLGWESWFRKRSPQGVSGETGYLMSLCLMLYAWCL